METCICLTIHKSAFRHSIVKTIIVIILHWQAWGCIEKHGGEPLKQTNQQQKKPNKTTKTNKKPQNTSLRQ